MESGRCYTSDSSVTRKGRLPLRPSWASGWPRIPSFNPVVSLCKGPALPGPPKNLPPQLISMTKRISYHSQNSKHFGRPAPGTGDKDRYLLHHTTEGLSGSCSGKLAEAERVTCSKSNHWSVRSDVSGSMSLGSPLTGSRGGAPREGLTEGGH